MKHLDKIKEILEDELGDYAGYFSYEIDLDENYGSEEGEMYEILVDGGGRSKLVRLFATDEKVEVEVAEDSWYQIESFEWTIKYFWMALLSWRS